MLQFTRHEYEYLLDGWAKERLEAVDAVCRSLMSAAADDQSTVRAVASALDKVRVEIRKQMKQK